MPSGVRGLRVRTDALELEVLGIRPTDDHSDDENDRHGGATQSATTTTADEILTTDDLSETESTRCTRWFHFGHKSRRRRRRRQWQQHKEDNSDDANAHETISVNYNIESTTLANSNNNATLAQPETTTIANSTHTIATPLLLTPANDDNDNDDDDEQVALTPQLPPLRSNSLANANGIDDRSNLTKLSIRQSEPNVAASAAAAAKSTECQQRPTILYLDINAVTTVTLGKTSTTSAPASSTCPPDLHLQAQTQTAITTTTLDDTKQTTTAATQNSGLRASFMSMLSSLAIWKDSNCWQQNQHQQQERRQSQRRRRSRHSQATTLDGSECFGLNDTNACEESLNKLPPAVAKSKHCNISADFEQISTATSTSALTSGKSQNNLRRLSQVRRRRSSYYFSENERRIRANDKEFNAQFKYHNNYIKTSKYTLFTFLPFNLLEQFQRLANFYFLCLLVLQLIPAISSLTPVTTAIPLIGVLTLTAVKDAYDDIQRHISDSQVNNRKSKTLRNGKLIEAKWSEVQVGDVIRLDNNQFVAADILLLTTSEPNGLCFIETAELDGETNLKCKQCLPETIELGQQHDELWNFNGEIICERPNNLLNKFDGTLIWRNQRYALDNEKILLRGCVLRNTQWCYGVVVFAGVDTKLMQNSGKTQFKSTGVDRLLNFIIIGIVLFLVSICAFFAIACGIWEGMIGQYFQVYLPWENIVPKDVTIGSTVIGLLVFFSYAIVLNTVVPISLYVSVEVIRFVQSFLINWDEEMYDARTNTYAKARTTTLNEELGQIQYIFSDKTGTLTQNIMTFNKCSINGRSYGDVIDLRTGELIEITDALEPVDFSKNPHHEPEFRWYDRTLLEAVRSDEEHAHNFFRLLSLCHTVMAEIVDGKLEYQAQSPDESALVSAARNFGFVFRTRTPNSITIEVMGQTEQYELLHILDFNNVRKRMSVVLRRDNTVLLYCKGADNVIYDRLHSGQENLKARTQDHLNRFAGEGLRTLVLAERRISEEFYNNWRERQQEAALSLDQREQKLNAIYEEIESEMSLVGVTAIEDKLQDGVPKSIANLQNAGIKIWVLTGDKQETAINIGYSCQLLTDELADVFIVDGNSVDEVEKQLRQFKESIKILNRFRPGGLEANNQNNFSMDPLNAAITQTSAYMNETDVVLQPQPAQPPAISVVTFSAECDELSDDAEKGGSENNTAPDVIADESTGFALVVNGHSLVHCLTPELETRFLEIAAQCKAVICCRVTPLQKALVVELIKRAKNAVTLAIGDGANDVSMIKAAHIGVGISGQEGLQAVLASDYSIAQFRFLERLLLVHGRWSYYRMCKFLRYFFYKNFAFTLCHCWYSLFCGFSAQTVFDPMFISVYNLFYTSLPVLALGVFEQDVSDKNSIDYPRLYTPGLKSELFNLREFIYSVLHGAFTSLILFLIPYGTYIDGIAANGQILSDHMTLGAVVATILIVDNTAQISLYTSYWTIVNHVTIWGSLVWYFVLDYFYNYVIGGPYVGALTQAIKDLTFWVTMLLTVTVLMAPVLAYKFYLLDVNPSLSDKIRKKLLQANARLSSDVKRTPSARRARRSVRSGYAFAHQEGFGRLITSGKIMHKMPQDLAFPLGLGSKKTQALHNNSNSAGSDHTKTQQGQPNNNNITNLRHTQNNTSMADLHAESNENDIHSRQNGELSPRAPCQDLDTINL